MLNGRIGTEQIRAAWRMAITHSYWRLRMRAVGPRAILHSPMMVAGPQFIAIGERSTIRQGARLEAIDNPNGDWTPQLTIGAHVNIEQGAHIVCSCNVEIQDGVSIAPYCVVVDTYHPYDPPDCAPKIGARLPTEPSMVRIGAGTFVGAHSVILPNVEIGRWCVVGAGSVVSANVPDYSIVAGVPARVLRRYDFATGQWQRCNRTDGDPDAR